MDATKRWYAVYTRSRYEKKVSTLLKETEIQEYLPLIKTLRQWGDRKKFVEVPLFRSYIFVFINNKEYHKVLNTAGVVCFVTIGHEKISIPAYQIEAVKTFLGEIEIKDPLELYELGDEVEVLYGPLKGLKGQLISSKNHKKLIVQIDAINQNITLTLPGYLLHIIRKKSA
jgi:transcriptional antiterminator RfaH